MNQKTVSVYCASNPTKEQYEVALELGSLLSQSNYRILNGGNGGCMEALALGSKKVEGSSCMGVTVPNDLPVMCNPYLTEIIEAKSMFDRLDILCNKADAIIALPGYLGTLNEILMSITLEYITDVNGKKRKPIFVSCHPWKPIWQTICKEMNLKEKHQNIVQFFDSNEELMNMLTAVL